MNLKDKPKSYLLSFDKLFSKQKIIALRLNNSSQLASISKVIIDNNRYFVLDKKFSQLYSFDETGKEIMKFGNVGLGKSEYKKISDFDIVNNQLAILSNDDQAIIFYDINSGKFLKRLETKLFGYSFALLKNKNILIYINQNNNGSSDENNVVTLDSAGHIIDRFFKFNYKKNYITITFSGFLKKTNDEVYYSPAFNNIVYRYNDNVFEKYINFGINSRYIDSNSNNIDQIYKETIIRDLNTSFSEENFLKNDNFIINSFQDSMRSNMCFYNTKNKNKYIIKKNIVQDPNLLLLDNPQFIDKSNRIVFNILPETIYYLKTSLPEMYNKLSTNTKDIFNKVNKNSNPLLMVCTVKSL